MLLGRKQAIPLRGPNIGESLWLSLSIALVFCVGPSANNSDSDCLVCPSPRLLISLLAQGASFADASAVLTSAGLPLSFLWAGVVGLAFWDPKAAKVLSAISSRLWTGSWPSVGLAPLSLWPSACSPTSSWASAAVAVVVVLGMAGSLLVVWHSSTFWALRGKAGVSIAACAGHSSSQSCFLRWRDLPTADWSRHCGILPEAVKRLIQGWVSRGHELGIIDSKITNLLVDAIDLGVVFRPSPRWRQEHWVCLHISRDPSVLSKIQCHLVMSLGPWQRISRYC